MFLGAAYKVAIRDLFRTGRWLLPLMIWLMLSIYWSAYPDLTTRRALREALEIVSVVLLMHTYSRPTEALRITYWSFVTILALDLASLPFPSFSYSSFPSGFVGIHGHKNVAGEFYFLALPLLVLAVFDRRITGMPLPASFAAICGAGLLLLSHSKTGLGLLPVTTLCVGAALTLRKMGAHLPVVLIIYLLIGMIVAAAVMNAGLEETVAFWTGDPSLTGRINVWHYVLARWQESPYLGKGFGALWQVGPQMRPYLTAEHVNWLMNEAHNGYLDVLAQIGIIGLSCLGLFLCAALGAIFLAPANDTSPLNEPRVYASYVIIGVLLYNITESSLVRTGAEAWILFLMQYVALRRPNGAKIPCSSPQPPGPSCRTPGRV
jgi:O-antigen ligase